jgi:hypothetical protein
MLFSWLARFYAPSEGNDEAFSEVESPSPALFANHKIEVLILN